MKMKMSINDIFVVVKNLVIVFKFFGILGNVINNDLELMMD